MYNCYNLIRSAAIKEIKKKNNFIKKNPIPFFSFLSIGQLFNLFHIGIFKELLTPWLKISSVFYPTMMLGVLNFFYLYLIPSFTKLNILQKILSYSFLILTIVFLFQHFYSKYTIEDFINFIFNNFMFLLLGIIPISLLTKVLNNTLGYDYSIWFVIKYLYLLILLSMILTFIFIYIKTKESLSILFNNFYKEKKSVLVKTHQELTKQKTIFYKFFFLCNQLSIFLKHYGFDTNIYLLSLIIICIIMKKIIDQLSNKLVDFPMKYLISTNTSYQTQIIFKIILITIITKFFIIFIYFTFEIKNFSIGKSLGSIIYPLNYIFSMQNKDYLLFSIGVNEFLCLLFIIIPMVKNNLLGEDLVSKNKKVVL